MRVVIIGASSLGAATARKLIEAGHDVIVVDERREELDALGETLDCGLIHGDGTLPSTLRNAAGDGADVLITLTHQDEDNILAALVGRSVGFERVIPQIVNPELGAICVELDLDDALFADETIAERLLDSIQERAALDAEQTVGGGMRLIRLVASEEKAGPAAELSLPSQARLVCVLHDGEASFAGDKGLEIAEGDGLIIVAREEAVPELRKSFGDPEPIGSD